MTDDSRELFIAREAANFDFNGQTVFVDQGTVVRAGHPILRGHENLFKPLHIHYEVPPPAPKPEKEDPPVRSVRADQQGARTR